MTLHSITIPSVGNMSPKAWYQAASVLPDFVYDAAQAAAIDELDVLWHQLVDFKSRRNQFLGRSLLSPEVPGFVSLGWCRSRQDFFDGCVLCLPAVSPQTPHPLSQFHGRGSSRAEGARR